jgi:hypothetical protein
MSRFTYFACAAVLLSISANHAQSQEYGVICPLFQLYKAPDGQFVEYCNAYATNCDDIPDGIAYGWDESPEPCDCPDTSGCLTAGFGNAFTNTLPPIAAKVAANGLPIGFSNKAVVVKSANVYVMKDGEPIYFRILHCAFEVDGRPDHTCAYSIGFEMKSPLKGIEGLTELQNCQPTDDPVVLKLQRGDRSIYLVRAALGAPKQIHLPAPTPAKSRPVPVQQTSLGEPDATGARPGASIMKRSEAAF